ncbi:MAG: electron transport complex subunit RsxC [Candidatus Hydrogenedentes bacterium]|nr:electron transport complex subunit RsxC [Candidatus Hydrogenedentota bacterium]
MLTLLNGWRKTFSHGLHPPEHKQLTADKPIVRLPFPGVVYVPLSQHTGAPAEALVQPGQEVVRGEPIAKAAGFVSVPMHAPVTGRVRAIQGIPTPRGQLVPSIVIDVYPSSDQSVLYGAPRDIDQMTPDDLVAAVQDAGVVGLGGAAFPTHVKLKLPEGKSVDTIIVNGCECEPYLTTDHRLMVEQPEAVLYGLAVIRKALAAERAIIGIEANKPDAARALAEHIKPEDRVEVCVVETKYPQGAEKMLIKSLLNREVPAGGLPADVGAAVFNVATLAQIGELVPARQGLIERIITVTGEGIEKPGNYLVALGTPIRHILDCVGLKYGKARVIFGGPMMGSAIVSWDTPVTKGVSGILVLPREEEDAVAAARPCIKCGACVRACPIHLNPCFLGQLARVREYDRMAADFHLMDCFECGCCTYVCPANIPLVQQFRVSKQIVRERKAAT